VRLRWQRLAGHAVWVDCPLYAIVHVSWTDVNIGQIAANLRYRFAIPIGQDAGCNKSVIAESFLKTLKIP
jgi:hypothetical protein